MKLPVAWLRDFVDVTATPSELADALTLVGLMERGAPLWLALMMTVAVMILLAYAVERVMLRQLVNQDPFTLLMATIGLNFFLVGLGEMVWGSNVKKLDVGIPEDSIEVGGMLLNQFDLVAAVIAAVIGVAARHIKPRHREAARAFLTGEAGEPAARAR